MIPIVSVVIVSYNSEGFIENCLSSVFEQKFEGSFEVIVVDNGSEDKTREIISSKFSQVKLIESENIGFGAGNNLGSQSATGEVLAFVNPDTVVDEFWLKNLTEPVLEKNVVTTSKVLLLDNKSKINTCGNRLHFSGYAFVDGFESGSDKFKESKPVDGISGAAFAIKRSEFERLGGFDEKIFLYCEDTELSWRCRRYGLNIQLVPDSLVYHRYELVLNAKKIYYLEFGRWSLLKRHLSFWQFLLLLPSLVMADSLSWAYSFKFGLSGFVEKYRAFIHAWARPSTKLPRPVPPMDLKDIGSLNIPFEVISQNRFILFFGKIVNLLFRINVAVSFFIMRKKR